MAAIIDNPAVARIALVGAKDVREMINTFHMTRVDGAELGLADLPNMANTLKAWYDASYKPQIQGLNYTNLITVRKQSHADPLAYDLGYTNDFGTNTGTELPANDTIAVSWRTGKAGRAQRGRFYAMGVPEEDVGGGDTITSAAQIAFAVLAQDLLTRLAAAGLKLVIFHRLLGTYTPIISVIVDSLLDSQRRRLPGRGR